MTEQVPGTGKRQMSRDDPCMVRGEILCDDGCVYYTRIVTYKICVDCNIIIVIVTFLCMLHNDAVYASTTVVRSSLNLLYFVRAQMWGENWHVRKKHVLVVRTDIGLRRALHLHLRHMHNIINNNTG